MIPTLKPKKLKNISKYKDLDVKFSRMWNVGTKIVPVIIGARAKIKEMLDQVLQVLSAIGLQKLTIMSNVYSIWYVLV
jgi:hypothetical protein